MSKVQFSRFSSGPSNSSRQMISQPWRSPLTVGDGDGVGEEMGVGVGSGTVTAQAPRRTGTKKRKQNLLNIGILYLPSISCFNPDKQTSEVRTKDFGC